MIQNIVRISTALMMAVMLFVSTPTPSFAYTSAISNQQIEQQQYVVLEEVVKLLQQNVKLLQMQFIRKLEARIVLLKAEADAK